MTEVRRGYLTMAVGSRRFLEMAVDMVLSLRQHTTLPVGIVVDETIRDLIARDFPAVFDEVLLLPDEYRIGRALKYGLAAASPFDETVFVDADCIVLGSLEHLWGALHDTDMALLGELLTPDDDENHHGFSTRSLMRGFRLDRYLKTNSGLFCFRRTPSLAIMEEFRRCYMEEARPRLKWQIVLGRWLGDEIAIGIVGGRRRLGVLPKPAEMYWPQEFAAIDLDVPSKPLLHMIWPLPAQLLAKVIQGTRARRSAAGLPPGDGAHWVTEQNNLLKMASRRRMLERMGL